MNLPIFSVRDCTWFASIHSTPGTPMETTCICAVGKTCKCYPGSKSSSQYLPFSYTHYPTLRFDMKLHLPSSPQQIWPVHQDHRAAWRRQAEAVLPIFDWQVLSWNTEVVKQTIQEQGYVVRNQFKKRMITSTTYWCISGFIIPLWLELYRNIAYIWMF